jgi:Platelet-activating factor acetylhydrolase, isoform II
MMNSKWRIILSFACAMALTVNSLGGLSAKMQGENNNRVQLTLPEPTGKYEVGTVSLHLVDRARQDPYWSTPHPRELMVSLWYPARFDDYCLAPWMSPGVLAYYRTELETILNSVPLDGVKFPITHARQGAPVMPAPHKYPVVLFSPGFAIQRERGTILVEDLTSHGYIVVTISHTYETNAVEFPDGRIELGRPEDPNNVAANITASIRRADVRFVIDKLTELVAGDNPDAEQRPLPVGLGRSLDMTKIGIFGHSLGGATVAQAMANDARIIAGINLDGSFVPENINPAAQPPPGSSPEEIQAFREALNADLALLGRRIHQPLMMMTSQGCPNPNPGCSPETFGDLVNTVWQNLSGYRRFLNVAGTTHATYTDDVWLVTQLADAGIVPLPGWVGTIPADRGVAVQRVYILSFFDLWLKDNNNHLLDSSSAQYPEVIFY